TAIFTLSLHDALPIYFARTVPVRQRKATMNFRFRRILWREEGVKLFFAVDGASIGIAKFQRPLVKILLDRSENFRSAGNEFVRRSEEHTSELQSPCNL